ncbi:uncharacterized protein MELLADRAFT_71838 [Melampsora larici-populina 98AG31]|uniref:Uncharacterized protein n=1 Tax=Melampsora larici-populina (strain 98AG31 / pathotype 3-4-7) TaxID=747676 RepID=F4RKY5_MELLP|nr:uncharacterized protein MELLADRAFT_71838 [Melampsora larici-populina 98AG31]EGG06806.1 hypothetical protein MELLADRAFT_71838 [Melampsora larici-populina 98AG31]
MGVLLKSIGLVSILHCYLHNSYCHFRNSIRTRHLHLLVSQATGSIKDSSQSETPMVSEPRESAVQEAHYNLTTKRNQDKNTTEDADFNLLKRMLASKLNLMFVDLDHHIGSRFSVNTLFKEVQKGIHEILPN